MGFGRETEDCESGGPSDWVSAVFDGWCPERDADGLAPRGKYILYHTTYERLHPARAASHRRWCVQKARRFRPGCTATVSNQPPEVFYTQFTQQDFVAIGV
jgi:hypothetical protein